MRSRISLALLVVLLACVPARAGTWAYVTAYHSGAVYVVDVERDRVLHAIPVEDRTGAVGMCVTRDGRRLVVVDGDERSRLRVFDPMSAHPVLVTYFQRRALRIEGPPTVRLSGDDAFLFVETRTGTRVFDMRRGAFRARPLAFPGCRDPQPCGGGVGTMYALCGQQAIAFHAVQSKRADFMLRARGRLPLTRLADAVATRDGTQLVVVAQVPPMRRLPLPPPQKKQPPAPRRASPSPMASGAPSDAEPANPARLEPEPASTAGVRPQSATAAPRPTPSPTPNPSLEEGAWRLASWRPGHPQARLVDLLKQVDLEKVSPAGLPCLAVSPDNKWIALVYARRAWILRADTLAVQWEIYPPGVADGAAFSADSQDLLMVLDGSLMRVRLANRGYRLLVPNQLRLSRPGIVVAGPSPSRSWP